MTGTALVPSGPVAVVTGATRGLGLLVAEELGRQGHRLVICARSEDGLAKAAERLRASSPDVVTVAGDISTQETADRLITTAVERFGRLDVLVTNAGIIQVGPVASMTVADFEDAVGVNLWGVVRPTLAALPVMRRAGRGRIVTITSIGGRVPAPHLLPYTTAKFGAVGFSEGLRSEVAQDGITVTTVVPGLMRTGSPRNALFKGDTAAEYRWFAVADSLPLLSIDASRAARRIVRAALRGRGEVVLTPAAKLGARAHGLAPNLTGSLAALVNRLLPRGDSAAAPTPGHQVESDERLGAWFRAATTMSRKAAHRLGQHDDVSEPGRQTTPTPTPTP